MNKCTGGVYSLPGAINKKRRKRKMEQKRGQETKKQERPFDILSHDDLKLIRGGDGDPPPVGNGDGK